MSVALLINLALADTTSSSPVVLTYEHVGDVPRERLLAIWCEEDVGPEGTLWARIVASRSAARDLRRPLAIWTNSAVFDLSAVSVVTHGDQWWMKCALEPGESLDAAMARYEQGLHYCPLDHVVLVLGLDSIGDDLEVAHVLRCAELARARPDIVGAVWIGTSSLDVLLRLREMTLPGPPPIEDVEPVGWGV